MTTLTLSDISTMLPPGVRMNGTSVSRSNDCPDKYQIYFVYETETYEEWFGSGWFYSLGQAIEFMYLYLGEDPMNIFKNDKLFPHIKGVMLKDKSVVLTLNGKVNIVELQGGDARAELFFEDHTKSAVVNRNQLLNIAALYGPETNEWKGKPVELYGEFGKWFGKETWGIRVHPRIPKQKALGKGGKPEMQYDIPEQGTIIDMDELEQSTPRMAYAD